MKHYSYLLYLLKHKWFVFQAGRKLSVPLWRLIIHDYSKFMPVEWFEYVDFFYSDKDNKKGFDRAWLHHQHLNPHHWQYWLLTKDNGKTKILEMPENYAREMVADWAGAGKAINDKWDVWEWYEKSKSKIILHPQTRLFVEDLLINFRIS